MTKGRKERQEEKKKKRCAEKKQKEGGAEPQTGRDFWAEKVFWAKKMATHQKKRKSEG